MYSRLLVPMPRPVADYLTLRARETGRHPRDLAAEILERAALNRSRRGRTMTAPQPSTGAQRATAVENTR
jgi:hypothetical protein